MDVDETRRKIVFVDERNALSVNCTTEGEKEGLDRNIVGHRKLLFSL